MFRSETELHTQYSYHLTFGLLVSLHVSNLHQLCMQNLSEKKKHKKVLVCC